MKSSKLVEHGLSKPVRMRDPQSLSKTQGRSEGSQEPIEQVAKAMTLN